MRTPEAVAAMLCPVCRVSLHMSDRQGVEIDYCPQCRGVWLDRGELDKIIERSADHVPASAPAAAAPGGQAGAAAAGGLGGLADIARDALRTAQHRGQGGGYGHDPRYRQKRKKSFLEQIFD